MFGAKNHHALNASGIVPPAIKENNPAGDRRMLNVTLLIPGLAIAVGRRPQRNDTRLARAQMLDNSADRSVLAGSVAPV